MSIIPSLDSDPSQFFETNFISCLTVSACEEAYNTTDEETTCIFGCKNQVPQLKKFNFDEVNFMICYSLLFCVDDVIKTSLLSTHYFYADQVYNENWRNAFHILLN